MFIFTYSFGMSVKAINDLSSAEITLNETFLIIREIKSAQTPPTSVTVLSFFFLSF